MEASLSASDFLFLLAYAPAFSIGLEEAVWTPQASTLSVFSALRSSVSASRPLFPSSLPIPVTEWNTKVQEPGVGLCQGSCLGICDKAEQDQKLPSLGTESCKPGMWIPFFCEQENSWSSVIIYKQLSRWQLSSYREILHELLFVLAAAPSGKPQHPSPHSRGCGNSFPSTSNYQEHFQTTALHANLAKFILGRRYVWLFSSIRYKIFSSSVNHCKHREKHVETNTGPRWESDSILAATF